MVAQRVASILDADQIVVLDEGRVVGVGTHLELMERCAEYREIATSQLSAAELERVARAAEPRPPRSADAHVPSVRVASARLAAENPPDKEAAELQEGGD